MLQEAQKLGQDVVARVRAIVTPANVNARDTAGRKSSPLHFAAGPANRSTRPRDHYRTDTGLGRSLLGFFTVMIVPIHNVK